MKTTLHIPDELVSDLRHYYAGVTKTALVLLGLNELLARKRVEDFKRLRGKVDISIDLDVLRDRSHHKQKI